MKELSYASCTASQPLSGETIGQCLTRVAREHAESDGVVSLHQNQRFTWGEFGRVVNRAAKAMLKLGIERGERVAIWSINNYEWVVAQFATAKIGAVLVNINPAYRTHELEYALRESRSKVLLLIDSFKRSHYLDMFYEVCPEVNDCRAGALESWRFPHLKSIVFIGSEEHPGMFTRRAFAELGDDFPDDSLEEREAQLDLDDVINIQYTSGTTGFPKGVKLSQHSILNNGYQVGELLGLTPQDRVCVPVPFYHCFGMVVSNMAAMTHGSAIIIPGPVFDPLQTLQAVQQEKCTVLHGVPTMFIAELNHPEFDTFDLSTLRTGIMAGAPCPIEVMRAVNDNMHMREVMIAYGLTETSPVATCTRRDDTIEHRVTTVGQVLPHQEIKVIDPVTRRIIPRGTPGEICMRGYHVMRGYDNNEEATRESIDEAGWIHSGDLGVMDDDGYIKITGRMKEMVIRGGENLYPREIEEFLHTLDAIEDAYVVGVPDKRLGEELLAFVRVADSAKANPPTVEQFRAMCEGKIAHFKVPRYWLVVDEFPMTVTGKIQKFKLREIGIRKLGLEEDAAVETA